MNNAGQGSGTSKSLQILSARKSLISRWRGPGEILPGARYTYTVIAVFSQELGAMAFEVTDQIDPLHEMEARGSRITVLFRRDSSANAQVDSNTNWTSFATLFYEGPASIQIPYRMPHTKPIGAVNMISTGPFPLEISGMYSCIPPPIAPSMVPTTANQSPYPRMFLNVVTSYRFTL